MKDANLQPFSSFGNLLRKLRESQSKSQAEVSGAVEIEQVKLEEYERGTRRPSEDILLLLIQHFNLAENEADELWRLAGYEEVNDDALFFSNNDNDKLTVRKSVVATQQESTIVYTDLVQVMVNNFGVVVNFLQSAGMSEKPLAVSRIGMSKEHARSVIDVLQRTLDQADELQHASPTPKQLPANIQQQKE